MTYEFVIGQKVDVFDASGELIGSGEIVEPCMGEYVVRLSDGRSIDAPADRLAAW